MYYSIIDFLLWLFTMSCIIHISMAVCSTMIQSIIVLSTCQSWQALHFFLYSPGMLACKELQLSSVEPDDHYPLTRTHNGVWMLGNLNTCRFLPLPGSEAKNSNLMMFYEGKKSMSMISWSRKGTQMN